MFPLPRLVSSVRIGARECALKPSEQQELIFAHFGFASSRIARTAVPLTDRDGMPRTDVPVWMRQGVLFHVERNGRTILVFQVDDGVAKVLCLQAGMGSGVSHVPGHHHMHAVMMSLGVGGIELCCWERILPRAQRKTRVCRPTIKLKKGCELFRRPRVFALSATSADSLPRRVADDGVRCRRHGGDSCQRALYQRGHDIHGAAVPQAHHHGTSIPPVGCADQLLGTHLCNRALSHGRVSSGLNVVSSVCMPISRPTQPQQLFARLVSRYRVRLAPDASDAQALHFARWRIPIQKKYDGGSEHAMPSCCCRTVSTLFA